MRSVSIFFSKDLDQADGLAVATIVPIDVHAAGIEVQVPRVLRAVGRGGPVVAVGPHVVHTSIAIAEARRGQAQKQTPALSAPQGSPCGGLQGTDPFCTYQESLSS